ncbi:MAG: metal ABC transporter permease [Crocinitomicaceae bacterium]|nr:metal ABC transporter permease [Crocinitomicaceae bacterium]
MSDFWIILTSCCACFLILRQMATIWDAICHAVLPGIVIAFLFSGSLDSVPMLIGPPHLGL